MTHDETYQALLLRKQQEARKAYSASNELADETESQVEAVMFAPDDHVDYGKAEDEAQAKFLIEEGKWQERAEKAFCWGMLVGGAVALAVYNLTLWLVGLL